MSEAGGRISAKVVRSGICPPRGDLHIRHPGDWDEPIFCEYLRRRSGVAEKYAELKIQSQSRFKHNRDAYTESKVEFIRNCMQYARR